MLVITIRPRCIRTLLGWRGDRCRCCRSYCGTATGAITGLSGEEGLVLLFTSTEKFGQTVLVFVM